MNYLRDLGFLSDEIALGASEVRRRRNRWTVYAYVCFCLGILGRQLTAFPRVDLAGEGFRGGVALAAFIIGLALFPPIMRWLNRQRKRPSGIHLVSAFSFGFFADLAAAAAVIGAAYLKLL